MPSRTTSRLCPLALLLSALLLLAAACSDDGGGDQTTPSPEASPGTPGPGDKLPQDFPEEFSLYPNATTGQTTRFGDQILVTAETDDSRSDVAAFYRDTLEEPPWEVLIEQDFPDQRRVLIRFAHRDEPIRGSVSVTSTDTDGQPTLITLRFTLPESVGSPVPRSPFTPTTETDSATPEGGGE